MNRYIHRVLPGAAFVLALGIGSANAAPVLEFSQEWSQPGAGSEIVAIDTASNRVFNTFSGGVEIRDLFTGNLIGTLTVPGSSTVNSVAVKGGLVAIAAQGAGGKQDIGKVAFFNTTDAPGSAPIKTVNTGYLPDMVTFTPDGKKVLVANEGEPNDVYDNDPEGSITIIDLSGGVASATATQLDFHAFDGGEAAIEADGGRIFGPGASVSQDLEPEYIAVSPDGKTAFVTLQENNAVAKVDLTTNTISEIQGLGFKDHSQPGNEFDASDKDGIDGNLQNWPVLGMYQPDGIASYEVDGKRYYVTANEGDARDYAGYSEETRVKKLTLDRDDDGNPDAFSPLQDDDQLGRLKTTIANGDIDGDGMYEQIYSYGARSMSIWDEDGNLVSDTGDTIERMITNLFPDQWVDKRSDDKGPEPESVELIEIDGWTYALVGMERTNGLMLFDITDPTSPMYMDYFFNPGDIGPEGLDFVAVQASSTPSSMAWGWLAVGNEVSNTTTLYRVNRVPEAGTLALMGLGLGLIGLRRRRA